MNRARSPRTLALACAAGAAALALGGCVVSQAVNLKTAERYTEEGSLAERYGAIPAAKEAYRRALINADLSGQLPAQAYALYNLGRLTALTCDAPAARELLERSLALQRSNPTELAKLTPPTLNELARLLYDTGQLAAAAPLYQEGLSAVPPRSAAEARALAGALDELAASQRAAGNEGAAEQARARAADLRTRYSDRAIMYFPRYAARCPDIAALTQRAQSGDRAAQLRLGIAYDLGHNVAQDRADAARWYRMAADAGDPQGQHYLAVLYQNGEGVAQDYGLAREWYEKAHAQGHAPATHGLGYLCDSGLGGPEDKTRAIALYRAAAEAGEPESMLNLAVSYGRGEGVPEDPVEAFTWLYIAETGGNHPSAAVEDRVRGLLSQSSALATPQQLATARRRADEWLAAHGLGPEPTAPE